MTGYCPTVQNRVSQCGTCACIVPPSGILFHLVKRQRVWHGLVSLVGTAFHCAEFCLKIYIFMFYINTLYTPIELQNDLSLYKNANSAPRVSLEGKVRFPRIFLYTCSGARESISPRSQRKNIANPLGKQKALLLTGKHKKVFRVEEKKVAPLCTQKQRQCLSWKSRSSLAIHNSYVASLTYQSKHSFQPLPFPHPPSFYMPPTAPPRSH